MLSRASVGKSFGLPLALIYVATLAGAQPATSRAAPTGMQSARAEVWVSVKDKNGQKVSSLRPEDVRLLEDGVPRRIISLSRQDEAPLALALTIDVSNSQEHLLAATKSIARQFVERLLRQGKDRGAVVSFSNETAVLLPLSGDLPLVRDAIDKVQFVAPPGWIGGGVIVGNPPKPIPHLPGSTALWDAVIEVNQKIFLAQHEGRRVTVLLTDGYDTGSRAKLKEAVESAIGSGVTVYAIGVGDPQNYSGADKESLSKITERSGGEAFFPKRVKDLPDVFAQLEASLRSQYLITYEPPDGAGPQSFRKLKIEIINPELRKQGLRVAHPEGYVFGQVAAPQRGK